MQRRKFIKDTTLAGSALLASSFYPFNFLQASANKQTHQFTILHTNDTHSMLEPFANDAKYNAGLGGITSRAAYIKEIRTSVEHVLLLDAGDIFQSSAYFDLYKGEPEIKAMNYLQYDAATIGEKDFSAGIDNLALQIAKASFPFVISNYEFTNTPLEEKTAPYIIIKKGMIKIGILGIGINLIDLIPYHFFGNTKFKNPISTANEVAEKLKKENCDFIICLSHLGDKYDDDTLSDEILAKENFFIDLIIGGHTHKFFKQPRKYFNRNGYVTVVNQVGWGGLQIGRLDYTINQTKNKNLHKNETILIREKNSE